MSRYRRSQAAGGTFFFTVALADRRSTVLVDHIQLLRGVYRRIERELSFQTIAICVLPDHIHAIWQLPESDADFSSRWSRVKSCFSRSLPAAGRSPSKQLRREKGIWQRRFWEHQIRDENDLRRHVDYVHFNPVKHGLVTSVADWRYSSFHRYVKDGMLPIDWAGTAGEEDGTFGEPRSQKEKPAEFLRRV